MSIVDKPNWWIPKEVEPADIRAIQDLEQGKASPEQQKRALDLIINTFSATYYPSFRNDPRSSDFMEGRRFVGLELVTLLKLNASNVRGDNNE